MFEEFSDERLIFECSKKNELAFDELCFRYAQHIHNYVFRYLNKIEETEELTQEILVAIYESLPNYDSKKGKAKTFIFTISRYKIFSYFRERERDKIIENLDIKHEKIIGSDDVYKNIENKEFTENLMRNLDLLPPRDKDVVNLRLAGVDLEEIAVILGITYQAAKASSSRGVLLLKEKMKEFKL